VQDPDHSTLKVRFSPQVVDPRLLLLRDTSWLVEETVIDDNQGIRNA
jgi:hypothetical protein